jgi:general stress protein 26
LHDGAAMSVVYHVPTDTDDLLISTMTDRAKAHAVARDGKVGLCVPGERWPFAFLQVCAVAEIVRERDLVADVMMAVAERMSGAATRR